MYGRYLSKKTPEGMDRYWWHTFEQVVLTEVHMMNAFISVMAVLYHLHRAYIALIKPPRPCICGHVHPLDN